jgi:DNA-directed RNA polymerase subunit RPC12/RpoP
MSDTFQLKTPERRRELHHCECGARFEVGHHGDVEETTATVNVPCPRCGSSRAVTVPRGTEHDLLVELFTGPEPEDGGGGGGD